ncbi:cutinase family protein [Candidatus Saccharibacteria bacterium]|nr:cutinase family protein [Candidatus Saccharibacteria bacterium]
MIKGMAAVLMTGACIAWWGMTGRPAVAGEQSCKSIMVIYARGSGQPAGAMEEQRFRQAVQGVTGLTDKVGYVELGRLMPGTYGNYPAAGVDVRLNQDARIWAPQAVNAIGAKFSVSWLKIGEYERSVLEGKELLFEFLRSEENRAVICAGTRFVMAGYSQGAQVIGEALSDERMRRYDAAILSVQLFGDPRLTYADAAQARPAGSWYRGSADSSVRGILGARSPYVPPSLAEKVGSWCRDQDGICSGTLFFGEHGRYLEREVALAGREAGRRMQQQLASDGTVPLPGCAPSRQDVVLAVELSEAVRSSGFLAEQVMGAEARSMLAGACDSRVAAVGFYAAEPAVPPVVLSDFTDDAAVFAGRVARYAEGHREYVTLRQSAMLEGLLRAAEMDWRTDAQRVVVVHAHSQPAGWNDWQDGRPLYENFADGAALRQVAKRYAGQNIDFRYGLGAMTGRESRAYAGTEQPALDALGDLLGGRHVTYGCSRYCYWRLAGTFAHRPEFRATPLAGTTKDQLWLQTTDLSEGRIGAARQAGGVYYEWDLDCDGLFEISGGSEAEGAAPLRFKRPRQCQGFARVRVAAGVAEGRMAYDSYTAALAINVRPAGEPVAVPPAIAEVRAEPDGAGAVSLSWRAAGHSEHEAVRYLVEADRQQTGQRQLVAVTSERTLVVTDVPAGSLTVTVTPIIAGGDAGVPVASPTVLVANVMPGPDASQAERLQGVQHLRHPVLAATTAPAPAAGSEHVLSGQPTDAATHEQAHPPDGTVRKQHVRSRADRPDVLTLLANGHQSAVGGAAPAITAATALLIAACVFATIRRCRRLRVRPSLPPP